MKRHSAEEIRAKLREARELEHRGLSQGQICKALAISVMTFHRWRKQAPRLQPSPSTSHVDILGSSEASPTISSEIETVRLENKRLRKIVTDLLLEKARILESVALHTRQKPSR
jgi:putative transposase